MNKISKTISEIISAKNSADNDAYLFLTLSKVLYLWRPAGEGRVADVGRKIIAQWKLSDYEILMLWRLPSLPIEKETSSRIGEVFLASIVFPG